jgi:uncharacterized membrane protein
MEWLRSIEFGLSPAALLVLIVYHVNLYRKVHNDPMSTSMGLADHTREMWVQTIMSQGKDILAVQTLRNWTMAATFLASTAILIALGVFNLAVTTDRQSEVSTLISHLGSEHPALWLGKLLLLGADFMYAFFNFTLAVRYFNHTGFMINLPTENTEIEVEDVVKILDRGGIHYTLGLRGYYLAIPLALWLFGPIWLMGGTIFLVISLYRLDRGV